MVSISAMMAKVKTKYRGYIAPIVSYVCHPYLKLLWY